MLALVQIRTDGELLQAFLPDVIATQRYPFKHPSSSEALKYEWGISPSFDRGRFWR